MTFNVMEIKKKESGLIKNITIKRVYNRIIYDYIIRLYTV